MRYQILGKFTSNLLKKLVEFEDVFFCFEEKHTVIPSIFLSCKLLSTGYKLLIFKTYFQKLTDLQ